MAFKYTLVIATSSPMQADKIFKYAKKLGLYVNALESIACEHSKESR